MATNWGNFGIQAGQNFGSGFIAGQQASARQNEIFASPEEVGSAYEFMSKYAPVSQIQLEEQPNTQAANKEAMPGQTQVAGAQMDTVQPAPDRAPAGGPVKSGGQEVRNVTNKALEKSQEAAGQVMAASEQAKVEKKSLLGFGQAQAANEIRQYREDILGRYTKEQEMIAADMARLKALNKPIPREVINSMMAKFSSIESDKAKAIQGVMKENNDMLEGFLAKYFATSTDDLKTKLQVLKETQSMMGNWQRGTTAAAGLDQGAQKANAQIEQAIKNREQRQRQFEITDKRQREKLTSAQQGEMQMITENTENLSIMKGLVSSGQVKPGAALAAKKVLNWSGDLAANLDDILGKDYRIGLSPSELKFIQLLQNMSVTYRKSKIGGAQTAAEISGLSDVMPRISESPELVISAIDNLSDIFTRAGQAIYDANESQYGAARAKKKKTLTTGGGTTEKGQKSLVNAVDISSMPTNLQDAIKSYSGTAPISYQGKKWKKSGNKLVPYGGK